MGKIRVKTLGQEEKEVEQKKRDEQRRENKRAKKQDTEGKIKSPSGKGGEKIKTVGPSEEDVAPGLVPAEEKVKKKEPAIKVATTKTIKKPHVRSKRYMDTKSRVDRMKLYSLNEALQLVKDTATIKFAGSVEAHFNLTKKPKDLHLKKDKALPVSYEKKFPLAHAKLGMVKDSEADLKKMFETLVKKIGKTNIKKITLSSTMGLGIKVEVA